MAISDVQSDTAKVATGEAKRRLGTGMLATGGLFSDWYGASAVKFPIHAPPTPSVNSTRGTMQHDDAASASVRGCFGLRTAGIAPCHQDGAMECDGAGGGRHGVSLLRTTLARDLVAVGG